MPRRRTGSLLACLVILGAPLAARSADADGGAHSSADLVAARALVGATLLDGTGGPPVDDAVVVLRGGQVRSVAELRPPQP